jgi:hypothetical protein
LPRACYTHPCLANSAAVMSSSSSSLSVTTRSRTGLFLSYRDSTARTSRTRFDDTDEHDRLIDDDAAHIALEVALPPTWLVYISLLSSHRSLLLPGSTTLTRCRRYSLTPRRKVTNYTHSAPRPTHFSSVTALDKLHAKHVLPGFSDRSLEEREIENITTTITRVPIYSFSVQEFLNSDPPLGFPQMPISNPKNWARPCLPSVTISAS